MSKVEVKNLTKKFGDLLVLDKISFDVGDGEFLCIVGPTGCGKTTFLNSLTTKPFTPMELLARVNSQLRRYRRFAEKLNKQNEGKNIHVVGGLELNEDTVEVTVDGEPVKLTPIEYKILLLLMKNPGRVFSSEEIYERVWNERAINTDTIMVHVRNIREKIESCPKEPKYLKVVWGVGYKIEKQA